MLTPSSSHPLILVTGAAGLVGRELMPQLAAAARPLRGVDLLDAPIPRGAELLRGDLLSPEICRRACTGVWAIIHTAARQHHSGVPRWGRERFFAANVEMTQNLIDAGLAAGVRHFVLVSSDMVYGVPRHGPFREQDEPQPIGPYGESKLASERVCEAARARGLRVTVLRPRLIIGPGRLGVLQKLFDRIRTGRPVPMLGSGAHRYQMVAVADVAAACVLAIQRPLDETLNLGSENPPPVRQLLGELCRRAGSASRLRALPFGAACAALHALHLLRLAPLNPEQFRIAGVDYVLDTAKATALLGWRPRHDDTEMLWQAYCTYVQGRNT